MKWEMEILSPTSYSSNSSWLYEESKSTNWTPAENKAFENALAVFDKDTPDRWQRVAEMVPGKTVVDVIKQYRELEDDVSSIEAGLVPLPGYSSSPFTLEWGRSSHSCDGFKQSYAATGGGKRSSSSNRLLEQERKKGVPWTEEEHKLFLMGLKKYGKGDWRNISRNYVITRTPTQVASHAQKYFMRQLSGGKDKRRASIHDITTVNLTDNQIPSPENTKAASSSSSSPEQRNSSSTAMNNNNKMANFQWNNQTNISNGAMMNFSMDYGNVFLYSPNGGNSYDVKNIQGQNLQRGAAIHEPYLGCQSMVFQMQSADQYPHA